LAPAGGPAPIQSGKNKTPIIVAANLGAAILITGVVFALGGSSDEDSDRTDQEIAAAKAEAEQAKKKAEEIAKKAEEEKKKLEAEMKKAKEAAAKKDDDKGDGEKNSDEEKKAEETKTAAAGDSKSGSSSSGGKDEGSKDSGSPAPAASGGPPFDVGAAKAALSAAAANAAACGKPGGPTGAGRVQLTFSTSGRVTSANIVSGPFGGTAVGGCVASAFRGARVPAVSGTPQTVSKSFKIQ
jgi:hypothetical protein